MLRRLLLFALLLPCAVLAAEPLSAPPGSALTAEQIVERNIAARGGLDAWRAIRAMVWVGRTETRTTEAASMRFVLEQARPNRTRFGLSANGEESVRVFDGQRGWKMRPNHGVRPDVQAFSDEEVRFAKDAEVIDGPLIDYAAHHSRIRLGGQEEVQGRKAWRIDVTRASGAQESVWIDAETFLDLRYDRSSYRPKGGEVRVSQYFHDYRNFDGVQLATVIEFGGAGGEPASRMVIEQVKLNPELGEFAFAEPGKLHFHGGTHPAPAPGTRPAAPE